MGSQRVGRDWRTLNTYVLALFTFSTTSMSVFCQFFVSCQDSCEPVIISGVMRITSPGPTSAPGPGGGSHSFPEEEMEAAGKDQGVPHFQPQRPHTCPGSCLLLWSPTGVGQRGQAGPGELGHAGLTQGVITDVYIAFSLPAVPSWTPESAQEALLSLGRWMKEAARLFRSTHPSGQPPARLIVFT
ncbi:hypothetical protein CapIbe_012803 [Capra ibex]